MDATSPRSDGDTRSNGRPIGRYGVQVRYAACVPSSLEAEIAALSDAQRLEVERELALRERAARIARELGLDPHDVRQILLCLALSPTERLRRGLLHGRRDTLAE